MRKFYKSLLAGCAAGLIISCSAARDDIAATQFELAPAQSAYFTTLVTRDLVAQHKVKKVDMIITREAFNPFEYEEKGLLEEFAQLPGISTKYVFSRDGLLTTEGNGMTSSMTYYHYDGSDKIIGQSFDGSIDEIAPAGEPLQRRMKWVEKGHDGKPITLNIASPCYGIHADYSFELEANEGLPTMGVGTLVQATGERFAEEYPDALTVYFKYEYYGEK